MSQLRGFTEKEIGMFEEAKLRSSARSIDFGVRQDKRQKTKSLEARVNKLLELFGKRTRAENAAGSKRSPQEQDAMHNKVDQEIFPATATQKFTAYVYVKVEIIKKKSKKII